MILPASIKRKWKLLATAFICPLTLIGVGIQQQPLQAQQNPSKTNVAALPDGIYLYGDSPQPNQVLKTILCFNARTIASLVQSTRRDRTLRASLVKFREIHCTGRPSQPEKFKQLKSILS